MLLNKNDVELIEFLCCINWLASKNSHHGLQLTMERDVLQEYIHHPNVDIILSKSDLAYQVTPVARLRAYLEPSTDHIIYLDPDEMMVLKPGQTIEDVILNDRGTVNDFHRYNIVNPVSLKEGLSDFLLQNLHKMYFHTPVATVNFPIPPAKEWIEWIKQPIPSKVLHQRYL